MNPSWGKGNTRARIVNRYRGDRFSYVEFYKLRDVKA